MFSCSSPETPGANLLWLSGLMAKRCSALPWANSHWKISKEKAPGLGCYLKFLEGRYAKEFSWPMLIPFPSLKVLQIQILQECVIFCLTLHYFWVWYKGLGSGRQIWVQIPFCHLLVMRSWVDDLTLLSQFSHLKYKSPWVNKCKASGSVLVCRQSSGRSSIFKYVIDPVLDVENTETIKHNPLKSSRSTGETPRHCDTCYYWSMCSQCQRRRESGLVICTPKDGVDPKAMAESRRNSL